MTTNHRILGSSPQAQLLQKLIQQGAATGISVLISGERGVGREYFARNLHEQSRRSGRFVSLSCAGLSEHALEAEVRRGLLDARGGSIFLDSIEEVPESVQSQLAQLSQAGDVRLMAATTASNIDDRLVAGLFGMRVAIAPLRDRRSDIPVVVDYFIREFAQQHRKDIRGIQPPTLKKLMSYPWPGNIREVRDAVERAVVATKHEMLELDDFAFVVTTAEERPLEFMIPGASIHDIEREAILRTLEHAGGSTTAAARILKMSVRKVQYKLKQYRNQEDAAIASKPKAKGVARG